jgi:hypothetical protein
VTPTTTYTGRRDACCDDDGVRSDGAAIFQRHDVTVPHSIKADGLSVDEIRPEYSRLLKHV